jgi:hypothetical protein
MSSHDSSDIKAGQVWERKADLAQVYVVNNPAPHTANSFITIEGQRRTTIRATGLRARYRLWRDVETEGDD